MTLASSFDVMDGPSMRSPGARSERSWSGVSTSSRLAHSARSARRSGPFRSAGEERVRTVSVLPITSAETVSDDLRLSGTMKPPPPPPTIALAMGGLERQADDLAWVAEAHDQRRIRALVGRCTRRTVCICGSGDALATHLARPSASTRGQAKRRSSSSAARASIDGLLGMTRRSARPMP